MYHTLKRTLARPMLALSIAASLTMTPLTAPAAQADGNNGRLAAAIVALGLIGIIAENNRGRHRSAEQYNVPPSKRLPGHCLKTFDTRHGHQTMFSRNCLRNNFGYWNALPEQCETTIRYYNHSHHLRSLHVFRPHCLDDWGYRVAYNH